MNINQNIENSASSSSNTGLNDITTDLQEALNKAYTNLNQISGENQTVDQYKKNYIEALINCYKHMYTNTTYPWVRYTFMHFQETFGEECIDLVYHPEFIKAWQYIFKFYTPLILNNNIINGIFILDTILQDISDFSYLSKDNNDKKSIFKEANAINNKIINRIRMYKKEIENMNNFIKLFVEHKTNSVSTENFVNCTNILFAIISDNKKLLKNSGNYEQIMSEVKIIFNKTNSLEIEKQINELSTEYTINIAQTQSDVFEKIILDLKPRLKIIYNNLPLKEIVKANINFLNSTYQYFTTLLQNASKEFNNIYGVTLEEIKIENIMPNININREIIEAKQSLEKFSINTTTLSLNKNNKIERDPYALAAIIAIKNLCLLSNKDEIINQLKEKFINKKSKDILLLIDATFEVITQSHLKSINSITISAIEKIWRSKMGADNILIINLYNKLHSLDSVRKDDIDKVKKEIIEIAWNIYKTYDYDIRLMKILLNTQISLKQTNSKFLEIILEVLPIYHSIKGSDLVLDDMVLQTEEHHHLLKLLHMAYRNNDLQIQNDLHIKLLALPNKYKYSHLDEEDILAEILEISDDYKKDKLNDLDVDKVFNNKVVINYDKDHVSYDFSLGEEVDTFDNYNTDDDGPRALVTFSKKSLTTTTSPTFPRSKSSNNLNITSSEQEDDNDEEYSLQELRNNNTTPFNSDDNNYNNSYLKPWI